MKKHLIITCLAFFFWGVGCTVQQLGIKAGVGFWPTIIFFIVGLLFFTYTAFTSLQKLKDFIKEHEPKKPDQS